jgi:hypothetical protein
LGGPKVFKGILPVFLVILLIVFTFLPVTRVSGAGANTYHTKHVIIVVMGGVRFSETFGDPGHRYIPSIWKELVPQGTLYSNFYNRGITFTRSGHSTIATGTLQMLPDNGPRCTMPTFFDYYREETGVPAEKTWIIFGRSAYSFLPYSSFPTYRDQWPPKSEMGIGESNLDGDQQVLNRVMAVIKDYKPNLIFTSFGYTDTSGHNETFQQYTKAVANFDKTISKLWSKIQSDRDYKDSTTLILTGDHGRHDDLHGGFRQHGCSCEGCRHLCLLIVGPDTKKGTTISQPASQADIAPTVGELLGFQTPLAEGQVLTDSLRTFLGLNRKESLTPAAKEAVYFQQMADRDLTRTVLKVALQKQGIADLPATPETALFLDGILNQMNLKRLLSPTQQFLINQATKDWLEKTKTNQDICLIYQALIAREIAASRMDKTVLFKLNASLSTQLPSLLNSLASEPTIAPTAPPATTSSKISPVDRAFGTMLLAHLITTDVRSRSDYLRVGDALVDPVADMDKLITSLNSPPVKPVAGKSGSNPHEDAEILYALSDALLSLETSKINLLKQEPASKMKVSKPTSQPKPASSTHSPSSTVSPTPVFIKVKLRDLCLLRYYWAVQNQMEPGGLWPDPIDSMLYLIAVKRLEAAGLFKGFYSERILTETKRLDDKSVLPEIVATMPAGQILAWTIAPEQFAGNNNKKDKQNTRDLLIRRKLFGDILEKNKYQDYSQELTRYLVNETGWVQGDNPVLALGCFLSLWSL